MNIDKIIELAKEEVRLNPQHPKIVREGIFEPDSSIAFILCAILITIAILAI